MESRRDKNNSYRRTSEKVAQDTINFCEHNYKLHQGEMLLQAANVMRTWLELINTENISDADLGEFAAILSAHKHLRFHYWRWAKEPMNDWVTSIGHPPFWDEEGEFIEPWPIVSLDRF